MPCGGADDPGIDADVSGLSSPDDRDHADRCLPVLLRVRGLRRVTAPEAGRLLCVLLVRLGGVPAETGRREARLLLSEGSGEPTDWDAVESGSPRPRVILKTVKRPLLTFLLVLVLGVQGPLVAYASSVADASRVGSGVSTGTPASPAEAQSQATPDSCCPGGGPAGNCCFTSCLASAGALASPVPVRWVGRALPPIVPDAPSFTSRGDAPLIRPPIP